MTMGTPPFRSVVDEKTRLKELKDEYFKNAERLREIRKELEKAGYRLCFRTTVGADYCFKKIIPASEEIL